ncbi:Holliday junction resolvase RecU [Marinilactibacillus psychrotolerans]|uniref:Holliday junction resolvase RecU n=1 Tax=Marinilactibacillus psychrotolerans TaxID=191770 RepID=UPI00388613C5
MQRTKSNSALLAKRNGENFERLIEMTCAYYSKMGVAYIQKTPEPMKPIKVINRAKRLFQAVYTMKAQPDFTGTLKNGKSVVFEAKHTDGTNIPFDRINDQQQEDLALHNHLGAMTFILISFNMKHFYAVPYKDWMQFKEHSGKKSVNQTDLVDYQISTEKGYLNILEGLG